MYSARVRKALSSRMLKIVASGKKTFVSRSPSLRKYYIIQTRISINYFFLVVLISVALARWTFDLLVSRVSHV